MAKKQTIYVSHTPDSENVYPSITKALHSLEADTESEITLMISPGIYREKLEIKRNHLTLIGTGASPADVVLTYDDFAFDEMPDASRRGTFRSYSVFIDASYITVSNLTIENSSGDENTHGQAIALYAEGDRLLFENVRLLGRQDTLFTGPLPPKEIQPGGFIGPKQFAPRINGRQHYKNCYICGNVDFIFGSATAVFENCAIESLSHSKAPDAIQGYVAAPSTPEGQTYGYLFTGCRFLSHECGPGTCYLARPWRDHAKAVFVHCTFGPHIHPAGFHDWDKPAAHASAFFAVYENQSVGQNGDLHEPFLPLADFSKVLTEQEAEFYGNIEEIFSRPQP